MILIGFALAILMPLRNLGLICASPKICKKPKFCHPEFISIGFFSMKQSEGSAFL